MKTEGSLYGKGIRVGVIGGSLGGLYTGLALRCIGCSVEIYERTQGYMEDRGAGLVVHNEMLEYLSSTGLPPERPSAFPFINEGFSTRTGPLHSSSRPARG